MVDAIPAVNNDSELSEMNTTQMTTQQLNEQLEMNDVQNNNWQAQVNAQFQSTMQSLANSTDDPAIAGQAPV